MSEFSDITTNNYLKCVSAEGGYCVQCYDYKNRYYWPVDTLTSCEGTALCANCLMELVIPASYFMGQTIEEIEEKLKEFSNKLL